VALGPRAEELEREHAAEEEKRRREAPRNYHPSMLRGTKPRSTATAAPPPPFASIVPHPQTAPDSPQGQRVLAVLHRLAADSGVVHVCRLHDFTVGILTELLPHEVSLVGTSVIASSSHAPAESRASRPQRERRAAHLAADTHRRRRRLPQLSRRAPRAAARAGAQPRLGPSARI
jgi:hypothetical protein